jgi:hypothetical protein
MDETIKTEAISAARRDIARRIAKYCTSFSSDDFDRLLDRMAYVQWKYEVLADLTPYPDSTVKSTLKNPYDA